MFHFMFFYTFTKLFHASQSEKQQPIIIPPLPKQIFQYNNILVSSILDLAKIFGVESQFKSQL